jgi:hypothetical protein
MSVKDIDTGLDMYGPFPEETNVVYSATLVDSDSEVIPALTSMEMTLYEKNSGVIINNRKNQNILNTSGGTFTSGSFTFDFNSDDTKMISKRGMYEDHIARFTYRFGTNVGRRSLVLRIQNLKVGVV